MRRFLAIFTTVITLSAAGAQANNMVWQQHNIYTPNGTTIAKAMSAEAPWQINAIGPQERYADLVRVNYAPVSVYPETITLLEDSRVATRHVNAYAQYGRVPTYNGEISTSNWFTNEAIPTGGRLGSEEILKSDWRKMLEATASVTTDFGIPSSAEMVSGTWADFIADGKRSDPADAGDLLIQMAKSSTFVIDDTIQTMNYGWTAETVAQTDPADAGYLLQPMLVANAGF